MSLTVGPHTFEGPYGDVNDLKDASGVYIVLCPSGDEYKPIDCGESDAVRTRIESHDRKDCWTHNCSGTLMFGVMYCNKTDGVAIEQGLRDMFKFLCGER